MCPSGKSSSDISMHSQYVSQKASLTAKATQLSAIRLGPATATWVTQVSAASSGALSGTLPTTQVSSNKGAVY